MSDIAIRVENLSKAYRIGLKEERHETLAGAVASFVVSPFRNFSDVRRLSRFDDAKSKEQRARGQEPAPSSLIAPESSVSADRSAQSDLFWALRDVFFEVKHGEVLGIIGRNGAGKSTLLKILSRITEPTRGRATIHGRVGSLLEVGTGFHPDLTGRENVYLNGTILGMRKSEVDRKFDAVVAFAEVEKFIDTPVKRYSSGMRVRLAFSVAAHLDPEILIIDEVLAVGDLNFQRKCLGKMQDVARQGRTVLFVSHNMSAIVELCQTGLVLVNGHPDFRGSAAESVARYVQENASHDAGPASSGASAGFKNLRVNHSNTPSIGVSQGFEISALLSGTLEGNPWLFVIIENSAGDPVIHSRKALRDVCGKPEMANSWLTISVPALHLGPGIYSIHLKALCSGIGEGRRILSERLPLEVHGDCDSLGRTLLAPPMLWQLRSP
jgi:lipopolysaccharide transport system ATP-binding protein